MIYKIKEIFLLFFLILLQSCSGGTIGNFLELSFDNLENINRTENSESILKNKKEVKKNIEIQKEENSKSVLKNKKVFNSEKKSEEAKKTKKVNKSNKKRKNELQTYKIIFILKDVDPKDPIEELSTILRNSDVNFEIEKIERFLDSKKNYE
tara:strand:+ start:4390 stop:4845 length:456 start_codon:yes stop_codon:yes gene_type:complete